MNVQGFRNEQLAWAQRIKTRGRELGFQRVGITDVDLRQAEQHLERWLANNNHGEMTYMSAHGRKRSRPELLVPGTLSIISVRYDYLPPGDNPQAVLEDGTLGYVSRYALGRDYHKIMRARLKQLAQWIQQQIGAHGFRVFVDSAPVLEKAIAEKAGLGWVGKHSNLLSRDAGSWFFLGEIYTDIPLASDLPSPNHCGSCDRCMTICPTRAITAPYVLDARRCISYLTIELQGSIPVELRPLMGNRIYGCDDCLLVCPWNRFARPTQDADFLPRNGLDSPTLLELFAWSEIQFLQRLEGSPIRRLGHHRWLRNLAVALGNAPPSPQIRAALEAQTEHRSELVREHVAWAYARQGDGSVT
jgi:epoxyqueuosine reductase